MIREDTVPLLPDTEQCVIAWDAIKGLPDQLPILGLLRVLNGMMAGDGVMSWLLQIVRPAVIRHDRLTETMSRLAPRAEFIWLAPQYLLMVTPASATEAAALVNQVREELAAGEAGGFEVVCWRFRGLSDDGALLQRWRHEPVPRRVAALSDRERRIILADAEVSPNCGAAFFFTLGGSNTNA